MTATTDNRSNRSSRTDYSSTGSSLPEGFFAFASTSLNHASLDDPDETEIIDVSLDNNDLYEALDILHNRILSLSERLILLEKSLSVSENILPIEPDDESYEEWLAAWKEEEPDVVMTEEDVRAEIQQYEKKYEMSSEDMLKKSREGTLPDELDFVHWESLLSLA